MHVVPFAHSFCAFDVVVGHVHATGVGSSAVNDNDFAVVSRKNMVDPWEGYRVELIYLDARFADFLQVMGL